MTIDMHTHLFMKGFYHESHVDEYVAANARWVPATTVEEAMAEVKRTILPTWWDEDGTGHIRRMDEAGIEKAVILHMDQALLRGETEMTIEQQNKHVSDAAKKYPDRLIWFCGVDPRREGAVELFERCVTEWGAQGLKLYPGTGFLPTDRVVYPLYERASAWKIPVLSHMGKIPVYPHMGPQGLPYKEEGSNHPSVWLRVLVDFPDLTVIGAHLANEFWRDLIALGKVRENVMCDISGKQIVFRQNYEQLCYILRKFLDEFGWERVMFGTDAPLAECAASGKKWVKIIKDLPYKSPARYRFTEEEVSALLDGNARRLLASIPQKPV